MSACRWITILAAHSLLLVGQSGVSASQAPPTNRPLSIEDVLKLSQGGLAEDVIITSIKRNGKPFDLSPEELVELKRLGITDTIIKFLVDPSLPYAPAPPAAADKPAAVAVAPPAPKPKVEKIYPKDAYASRIPPEPGLYAIQQSSPVTVDIKLLLAEKKGPGLGKVLLKKGKVTAYLVGPTAKMRAGGPAPVFYFRPPEGVPIEEVLLVALSRKDDRREVDVGPPGPKHELDPESLRRFDPLEVGSRLFRLTADKLDPGEYMFYLINTAEPPKGNHGKVYDFGVDAPKKEERKR
jgi:hypothetical protein